MFATILGIRTAFISFDEWRDDITATCESHYSDVQTVVWQARDAVTLTSATVALAVQTYQLTGQLDDVALNATVQQAARAPRMAGGAYRQLNGALNDVDTPTFLSLDRNRQQAVDDALESGRDAASSWVGVADELGAINLSNITTGSPDQLQTVIDQLEEVENHLTTLTKDMEEWRSNLSDLGIESCPLDV